MYDFIVGRGKKEYNTIQEGIDAAANRLASEPENVFEVVFLKPGTYVEDVQLKHGVSLLGAWPGVPFGEHNGGYGPSEGWHAVKIVGDLKMRDVTKGFFGFSGVSLDGTLQIVPGLTSYGGPLKVAIDRCFLRNLHLFSVPHPGWGYTKWTDVEVAMSVKVISGWTVQAEEHLKAKINRSG